MTCFSIFKLRFPSKIYFVVWVQNEFSICEEEEVFQPEMSFSLIKIN